MTIPPRNIIAGLIGVVVVAGGLAAWRHFSLSRFPDACRIAARKQDWRELQRLADEWTKRAPSTSTAWYWLGEAHRGRQNFDEAMAAYEKVGLTQPRGVDAAIHRMELEFHVFHRPLVAVQLAEQLLEHVPRMQEPLRHLVYFDAMALERGPLLKHIRRAIEARADLPLHYVYLFMLEDLTFSDSDAITLRWLEQDPENPRLQSISMAQQARNARAGFLTTPSSESEQEYKTALAAVAELRQRLPDDPRLLEVQIVAAMDDGQLEIARELLEALPEDVADDPVFWLLRGRYDARTEDFDDAEVALRTVIELHPLAWQARHELAQVLRSRDQLAEAQKQQEIAASGSEIVGEIRRLQHIQDASRPLMEQIARYAQLCQEWSVANGIVRRYAPGRAD